MRGIRVGVDAMGEQGQNSLSDEEFQEIYDKARMALHLRKVDEALRLAQQLAEKRPDSTTAHELLGDALAAANKLGEAEAEYRRAIELEPANADAQRKLGEVVLRIKDREFQKQMLEMRLQEQAFRGMGSPEPEGAALRSGLFPGLGQLYNGEYEKGFGLAAAGLVCLGLIAHGAFAMMTPEQANPYATWYLTFGLVAGLGVYVYSIWDAARGAREHGELTRLYRQPDEDEGP